MDSAASPTVAPPSLAPPVVSRQLRIARLREDSHYSRLRHTIDAVLICYFAIALFGMLERRGPGLDAESFFAFAYQMVWAYAYRLLAQAGVDWLDLAVDRRAAP